MPINAFGMRSQGVVLNPELGCDVLVGQKGRSELFGNLQLPRREDRMAQDMFHGEGMRFFQHQEPNIFDERMVLFRKSVNGYIELTRGISMLEAPWRQSIPSGESMRGKPRKRARPRFDVYRMQVIVNQLSSSFVRFNEAAARRHANHADPTFFDDSTQD
jgi:hypothetical protein